MPRYVVLHHEMPAGSDRATHWDFMLEEEQIPNEKCLATWALEQQPDSAKLLSCCALEQHRKHYLDYEGPVAGNRGNVRRWDSGVFDWLIRTDDGVSVSLSGQKLDGSVKIWKNEGSWQFQYTPSNQTN